MSVKAQIQFRKVNETWDFEYPRREEFIEHIVSEYVHSEIEAFTVESTNKKLSEAKTKSQLGYLHAEILEKALIGYGYLGWDVHHIEQIKPLIKQQIGFYEYIENTDTGFSHKQLKSFGSATKDELRIAIDSMILFIQEDLKQEVEDPDVYKKRMGITEFSK